MTAAVLNTNISEVENKTPNAHGLVKKTDYDAKILEIEVEHIATFTYNKFTSDIHDGKIKQKELVNKCISNLVKHSGLNTKLAALATKTELKEEEDKTVKLQTYNLN